MLLQAESPIKAAEVYRHDLKHFPNNGWSLFGLIDALRWQGRVDEAEDVERRFEDAWQHADVTLSASRF